MEQFIIRVLGEPSAYIIEKILFIIIYIITLIISILSSLIVLNDTIHGKKINLFTIITLLFFIGIGICSFFGIFYI